MSNATVVADRTPPQGRQHKQFSFDVKEVQADGTFSGYASVFNVVDSYGDVILPGAFKRTIEAWAAKGKPVPVLWQHRGSEPIGATTSIKEDDHGLYVTGQLLIDKVARASEAHALAAAGVLGGLSIGFSVPRKNSAGEASARWLEHEDGGGWEFNEVRLWEYSLVTWPANEEAVIESVKSFEPVARELRELVAILRGAALGVDSSEAPSAGAEQSLALAESIRQLRQEFKRIREGA